ncbi:imelysin family protein [Agrobacterium vitis]
MSLANRSGFLLTLTLCLSAIQPLALRAQDAAPHASALQTAAVPDVMEKTVDGFIRPGYRNFLDKAKALHAGMNTLCTTPSDTSVKAAKDGFEQAVRAWARIEIVRVGPVIEENRFEHILFYPDRKGLALKQIQGAIASNDESFTKPEALHEKSVAIQGLGALEYVLYGTGSETLNQADGAFRCRYGAAIAGNIENMAGELSSLWEAPGGIQTAWKQPGPNNDVFRTPSEAVTGLLGILVHGTETVRDERIETFFKGAGGRIAPKQAIFWRSGLTFVSMQENLTGLKQLLNDTGAANLLPEGKRGVIATINTQADRLIQTTQSITPDVEAAVGQPDNRKKLVSLLDDSRSMITDLSDGLGGGVGLSAGFSFADGD